eukprot:2454087-Pleurochrysis_carterae.AAC.1
MTLLGRGGACATLNERAPLSTIFTVEMAWMCGGPAKRGSCRQVGNQVTSFPWVLLRRCKRFIRLEHSKRLCFGLCCACLSLKLKALSSMAGLQSAAMFQSRKENAISRI